MSTYVDPSSLSLPSPSPSHPSPSPDPDTHTAGPSRKRPRSEVSTEERKEARAHRNRIAAQNSRDRRKAQFSFLEKRVAELEEENQRLRAGMGVTQSDLCRSEEVRRKEEDEKEKSRERENEELRERIRILEKSWDAVVKALAAQGLPTGLITPPASSTSQSEPPTTTTTTTLSPSQPPPPATFPVFVPPPVYPLSPAPSTSDSSVFSSDDIEFEPTRHLAAGGLTTHTHHQQYLESQSADSEAPSPPLDDAAMEDLFREILAPSPSLPSAPLPLDAATASSSPSPSPPTTAPQLMMMQETVADWEGEAEMQKLLDMLPGIVQPIGEGDGVGVEFPSALDLELGWDLEGAPHTTTSGLDIKVF